MMYPEEYKEMLTTDPDNPNNEWTDLGVYRINKIQRIKTKNDALLNCKHDDDFVRHHCNMILTGKTKVQK